MSKQSDAKQEQGYTETVNNCGNCKNLQSDLVLPAWMANENKKYESINIALYSIERNGTEKNFRCGIGGFKAKKTAVCKQWGMKVEA